jgi:hypothetical protein
MKLKNPLYLVELIDVKELLLLSISQRSKELRLNKMVCNLAFSNSVLKAISLSAVLAGRFVFEGITVGFSIKRGS